MSMKKLFGFLLLFALLLSGSVASAQEGCYSRNHRLGVEAYNKGDKAKALRFFRAAKECPDKPKRNDLDKYIQLCQPDPEKTQKKEKTPKKEYTVDVDGYTKLNKHFEAGGGSIRLYVKTNASSWELSFSSGWCTAKKDGNAIDLTVTENRTTEKREGTCYVYAEDKSVAINVSQDAGRTYLEIDGQRGGDVRLELKAASSTYHISINTNASTYSVRNYPSWVEISNKSDDKLNIRVHENDSAIVREGVMVISAGNVSTKVALVQEAAKCYLKVGGNSTSGEWNLSHTANDYKAYILTNAPSYSVADIPKWVSVIAQKQDTLKVHVLENPTTSNRQGVIRIEASNMTFVLTVNQKGKPESKLLVDGKSSNRSYAPTAAGGSYTFTVSTDHYYYIEGRPDWITVDKKNSAFDVNVLKNETSRSRSATLQIKSGNDVVQLVFNQPGMVEQSDNKGTTSAPKSSGKPRHDRVVDWSWNLTPDNYLGGLSIGYTSNQLRHYSIVDGSTRYDWLGEYAWGKFDGRLHGIQVGFHVQRYTNWTLGVGIYTGTFFNIYHSWNNTEEWSDPESWGYNYTDFEEFSATVPLHLYLHLPILTNKIGLFAHVGPDLTYYWGAMYRDSRNVNLNRGPLFPMSYSHDCFLVGISTGVGFHIGQFEMEVLSSTGRNNSYKSEVAKSFINQFSVRISYLFHKI